jgi:hypothetical protein
MKKELVFKLLKARGGQIRNVLINHLKYEQKLDCYRNGAVDRSQVL